MLVRSGRLFLALLAPVALLFIAPSAIPDPLPRDAIVRGDFNSDDRPDLLIQPANGAYAVTLQLGGADGALGEITKWNADAFGLDWSAQGSRVLVGDFNGDGKSEFFVQSRTKGGTSALIAAGRDGRPTGVMQVISADLLGWEWTGDRVVPVVGDFNGDARDEVLLQSLDEFGAHYVMLTNEAGEFAAHGQGWIEDYLDLRWTAPASALHAGDFDGDGNADLLIQPVGRPRADHPNDALYALLLADGKGRFNQVSATWDREAFGAEWDPMTHELIVRDVDGDRIADVWLRPYSPTGTNFLVLGRASGRFESADLKWMGDATPETAYARERSGQTGVEIDGPTQDAGGAIDEAPSGLDEPPMMAMMSNAPAPLNPTDPGTLKGEFSVDPTGAVNYRIPIAVPPGVAGMQPDLALLYSSRAGNGHLGVGWSISGLSAITRCPPTIEQDALATMKSIALNQTDKFCLDGQRLMVKSGQSYGNNATQYHTEIASFQRITAAVTNPANGPDSFEVHDKAGLIRQYGTANSVDARIEAAPSRPQALVWALNRISDRNGNYIQFNYSENTATGEYRPTLITWSNGVTQIGKVEIGYEARPDTRFGYMLSGAKKALTQRVNEIRAFDGTTLVSGYRLLYGTSSKSGLSQLSAVQRCNVALGSSNPRCLSASTFEWQDGQKGFAPGPLWDTLPSSVVNVKPVDINGNGAMELVYAKNGVWNIKSGVNYSSVETVTSISTSNSHLPYSLGIDVNSDGYQDFAIPHTSSHALGAKWGFYLSTGTTLNSTAAFSVPHEGAHDKKPVVVDIDGDVRPDFVFKKNQQLWFYRNMSGTFNTANSAAILIGNPTILGDQDVSPIEWDGDGLPDLFISGRNCQSANSCWQSVGVWRNTGNFTFAKVAGSELKKPILGDINGDGLTDLIDFETSVLKVYMNTGGAWALTTTTQTSNYGDSAQVIDFNEDGRQDILVPRGDERWHAYYWDESGLAFTDEDTGTPVVDRASSSMFDFDGNGKPDIMYLVTDNGWKVRAQDQHLSGLAWTFTDGDQAGLGVKGVQTFVSYTALNHVYGGHRADGMDATGIVAPRTRHFSGPMPVARITTMTTGAPYMVITSYTYLGGKLNQHGRGFLGFREVKANNSGTGILTINTHRQDFPFTGMIEGASQDTLPQTVAIYTEADAANTRADLADLCVLDWETKICNSPPSGPSSVYTVIPGVRVTTTTSILASTTLPDTPGGQFPYVDLSTTNTFELNGGAPYRREITDFTYGDNWGNPTKIEVTTSDGSGGNTHTTTTNNTFTNDATNWILSRLTQAVVTTTAPGAPQATRTSTFTYAAVGQDGEGQLLSERVEPNSALEMSKTYTFDSYGNRLTETLAGSGVTNRQTIFGFDSNGRFVTSVTGPTGFVESRTWDGKFGVITGITDPNGNSVASTYDSFGRKTLETGPRPGTSRGTSLELCSLSSCTASARGAIWRSVSTDSAGRESITEFDMFDRELLTRSLDWKSTPRYSYVETIHDERGRVSMKSAPFFSGEPRCWSKVVFDGINRPTQERSPANVGECLTEAPGVVPPSNLSLNRVVTTAYSVSGIPGFNAQLTTRTDPTMSRAVSTWVNSMGRTVRVSEVDEASQTLATTFQYDGWGNTKSVTDPNGVTRSMTYNARGFKLNMTDPDMGFWQYSYNAFGELISQTDARNQTVTMTYDDLGRLRTRTEPHGAVGNKTTTRNYDSGGFCLIGANPAVACSSLGRLISVVGPGEFGTNDLVEEHYAYDQFGALRQSLRKIDGKAFWTSFDLDAEGRVATIRYPDTNAPASGGAVVQTRPADVNEFKVQNHYQRGVLTKVTGEGGTAPTYWELKESTAWGGASKSTLGNGIDNEVTFDIAKQLPTLIQAKFASALLIDQSYLWNQAGNLIRRVDNIAGHGEDFAYDAQHRLKQVTLDAGYPTGPITYTNEYDKVGKLTKRYASAGAAIAVTDYAYDATQPHAVDSVKFGGVTQSYGYDLNGNATSARGMPVSWTAFNMPYEIGNTGGGAWSRFVYGPDRARWKQTIQSPGFGQGTTYYIGSLFEREERGIAQIFRYTVFAGGQAVAYHKHNGTSGQTSYLHRDHLGSVVAITDAAGAVRERYSFDAWGKRRPATTWSSESAGSFLNATSLSNSEGYRRGFTGHEMLDHLGLVHMNGRVYDPEIGRFLSADPMVQFPDSTQGYDRYQYVNNNPLSATDPSGYELLTLAAMLASAAAKEGTVWIAKAILVAAAGYAESGGDIKTVATAFASAGTANWVGDQFLPAVKDGALSTTQVVQKALLHGTTQGAISAAGGGRFGDGALGAFAGGLLELKVFEFLPQNGIAGLVANATVGGTLNAIGGGKFANGANSAAMVYLFNKIQHTNPATPVVTKALKDGRLTLSEANAVWRANNDEKLSVTVDASKLTVEQKNAFQSDGRAVGEVKGADWLVHGSVTLQLIDGKIYILPDRYDFMPNDVSRYPSQVDGYTRNAKTYGGFWVASRAGTSTGTDYTIRFSGNPNVIPSK